MAYTREDLCAVVGCAFEWLIAMEKTKADPKMLLGRIAAFNRLITTQGISIEELPKETVDVLPKVTNEIDIVKKTGFKSEDAG